MNAQEERLAGEHPLHRLLEWPPVYRLATLLLAPGAESRLRKLVARCAVESGLHGPALDVGCGPFSRLDGLGFAQLTGVDISPAYIAALGRTGVRGAVSSADALPFATAAFDSVWNIGLLHHLPDEVVRRAVCEMRRVCASRGRVVVIDAVLPHRPWRRPFAWLTRRLDRGRHMRTQTELEMLLNECGEWHFRRETYALNGLECLVAQGVGTG